jgi:hypothetical protein
MWLVLLHRRNRRRTPAQMGHSRPGTNQDRRLLLVAARVVCATARQVRYMTHLITPL